MLTLIFTILAVVVGLVFLFHKWAPNTLRDLHALRAFIALLREMADSGPNFIVRYRRIVERFADKEAMVDALTDKAVTFRELDERSNRIANWAIGAGLSEGQGIALLGPNTAEFVVWWLGFVKAGLRVAFLNFNLRGRSLAHCIQTSDANALVVLADPDGKLLPTAEEVFPQCETGSDSERLRFFAFGGDAVGATRISQADLDALPSDALAEERIISPDPEPMLYVFTR